MITIKPASQGQSKIQGQRTIGRREGTKMSEQVKEKMRNFVLLLQYLGEIAVSV